MDEGAGDDVALYPNQVDVIDDIFHFSYYDLECISAVFNREFDIKFRLLALLDYLSADSGNHDMNDEFTQLVKSELDIISFSKESRSSVISF